MDIKAIFFDIDGTLVPVDRNELPASTKQSLEKLRARGIKTIIATGRFQGDMKNMPVMEAKFDGYLTLNGQVCLDEDMHLYSGSPIPRDEMEVLAAMFSACKIPFVLVGAYKRYINYVNKTVVDVQGSTNSNIPDIGTYNGEDIYQICAFVSDRQKAVLSSILDKCSITSWNELGIDIIARGGGKQEGIKRYMQEAGLRPENIMAFGDGENDIEMLRLAGIGVAMGNASDAVKAAADYVTDGVSADGVEHALKHFGLI